MIELQTYDVSARRDAKMKSDDRIIVLGPIDGKHTLSSTGGVDNRLFTGENKLHATYNEQTGMWSMHYDVGALPGGLKLQFTLFSELLAHVKAYFKSRNVQVLEVKE